jgi:hypothetical protein
MKIDLPNSAVYECVDVTQTIESHGYGPRPKYVIHLRVVGSGEEECIKITSRADGTFGGLILTKGKRYLVMEMADSNGQGGGHEP